MLNIECQSLVLFKDKDYNYICDSFHRIQTTNKYINYKLKLILSGLEYFTGLTEKSFNQIEPKTYQDPFQKNIYLKIKIYEYTDAEKNLIEKDELIQKVISTRLIKNDLKSKQIDTIMVEIRNLLCLAYNNINEITKYNGKMKE